MESLQLDGAALMLEGKPLTSALLHRNENFSHCETPEACKLSKRVQLDPASAHDDIGLVLPGADRSTRSEMAKSLLWMLRDNPKRSTRWSNVLK
uniref:Uncharacterized protein n=1 Tax=Anopheles minimus TaxID=112268 RepID=A0A182WNW6_9DIPT